MDTVYSLSSGALGAVLVTLAWLVSHSAQITKVLQLIPTVQKDVAAVKSSVDQHLAAVKSGAETAVGDAEKLAAKVAQHVVVALTPAPAVAPAADPVSIAAPAGAAEGTSYTVVNGVLVAAA